MDVSENSGTPKSSIFIGFSIIKDPFWDTPIFGNIHIIKLNGPGNSLKDDDP